MKNILLVGMAVLIVGCTTTDVGFSTLADNSNPVPREARFAVFKAEKMDLTTRLGYERFEEHLRAAGLAIVSQDDTDFLIQILYIPHSIEVKTTGSGTGFYHNFTRFETETSVEDYLLKLVIYPGQTPNGEDVLPIWEGKAVIPERIRKQFEGEIVSKLIADFTTTREWEEEFKIPVE